MDRNIGWLSVAIPWRTSLSARRAWIEIWLAGYRQALAHVALRKESVDRNGVKKRFDGFEGRSLSARRAWIEIMEMRKFIVEIHVALRKESVDRNRISRLPRSGTARSLSARRAWIEISGAKCR